MRVVVFVALLAVAAFAAPVIIVHKEVSEPHVLHGGELRITTTAHNVGDEPATDFVLEDQSETKKVASFGPGENVTITSTVTAHTLGNLDLASAVATWAVADETTRRRATSNQVREEERDEKRHATEVGPRGFVNVVTSSEYERITSRFIKETILFTVFALVIVGFPFGVYRQKKVQVELHLKEARKK
jgi:hypothetical protein